MTLTGFVSLRGNMPLCQPEPCDRYWIVSTGFVVPMLEAGKDDILLIFPDEDLPEVASLLPVWMHVQGTPDTRIWAGDPYDALVISEWSTR